MTLKEEEIPQKMHIPFYSSIAFRLLVLFLLPVGACLTTVYFSQNFLESYKDAAEAIRNERSAFMNLLVINTSRYAEAEGSISSYIYNKTPQSKELFQKTWDLIQSDIKRIAERVSRHDDRARLQRNFQDLKNQTQTFAIKAGQSFAYGNINTTVDLSRTRIQIQEILQKLQAEVDLMEAEQMQALDMNFNRNKDRALQILGAILCFAVFLAFIITAKTVSQIKNVGKRCHEIATGKGDLTQRFMISSQDEIGELTRNFDTFLEHTSHMVSQTITSAKEVTRSIISIADFSDQFTNSTQILRKNSALELLSMDRCKLAFSKLQDSLQSEETQQTIAKLRNQLDGIAKISTKINAIHHIANEAKFLSINTAIEAAKSEPNPLALQNLSEELQKLSDHTTKLVQEISENSTCTEDVEKTVSSCNTQLRILTTSVETQTECLKEAMEQILTLNGTIDSNANSCNSVAKYASALTIETERLKTEIRDLSYAMSKFQLSSLEETVKIRVTSESVQDEKSQDTHSDAA